MNENNENFSDNIYNLEIISDKIKVPPKYILNSNEYILDQLRKNENKCTKFGFLQKIVKLINKSYGTIYNGDFTGSLLYHITYSAYVCNPQINDIITCTITQIIENEFMAAENDPFFINVLFNEDDGLSSSTAHNLNYNDKIWVQILAKRINLNENKIKIVAKYIKRCE